jgi:hypothetical protein
MRQLSDQLLCRTWQLPDVAIGWSEREHSEARSIHGHGLPWRAAVYKRDRFLLKSSPGQRRTSNAGSSWTRPRVCRQLQLVAITVTCIMKSFVLHACDMLAR